MTHHTDDDVSAALAELNEAAGERISALESKIDQLTRQPRDAWAGTYAEPRGTGRVTEPDPLGGDAPERPKAGQNRVIGSAARNDSRLGFETGGHFLNAVKNASMRGGETDERLMAALTTFGNESNDTDSGYAIPPNFRNQIMKKAFSEDSLLARCFRVIVAGNNLSVPTSMVTPWDTTNGIQCYWEAEGSTLTQSKPQLEQVNIRLHKLAALVPVTEELLEDSPAMGSFVQREASAKIDWKVSNSIVRGNGVG